MHILTECSTSEMHIVNQKSNTANINVNVIYRGRNLLTLTVFLGRLTVNCRVSHGG